MRTMTYKIDHGQDVILAETETETFLHIGYVLAGQEFTEQPVGKKVKPSAGHFYATEDTKIEVDHTKYLQDENGVIYPLLIGGRPRSFVRR
jgi:hypothetical protein